MTRAIRGLLVCSAAACAVLAGMIPASGNGATIPLGVAEIHAELNDTDGDLGFHGLIDGEAWDMLVVENPIGRAILSVRPSLSLGRRGLTELSFESAEPALNELTPADFFARFAQGSYRITGRTIEGDTLEGSARFSHLMPAPPANVQVSGVPLAADCEGAAPPPVGEPIVISWDPVTASHPDIGGPNSAPIKIVRYQVVVEREGANVLVYSVDLPGNLRAYEMTVPPEFIALGDEFKYAIVVRAKNGNQTALESCFALQ